MKKKTDRPATTLPSAWRTNDGISIVELVAQETKKRRLRVEKTMGLIRRDPIEENQLLIQHHRCQVLPARIIEPDPKHPRGQFVRLHPASRWASTILIYVPPDYPRISQHTFFVVTANENTKRGAWSVRLKSLLPNKNAWHLLKMVAPD